MNPYSGQDFFGFFAVLFSRIIGFASGTIPFDQMASDEVQCFTLFFLSIALSFLGSFLVLKQMTMLANALSHTILLGIVVSFLVFHTWFSMEHLESSFLSMKVLLTASLVSGLLTVFCTQLCTQIFRLQEDASIGFVFTTFFALGVLLVTMYTKNLHLGTEAVMGNIDALHIDDLKVTALLAMSSLVVGLVSFRGLYATSFDKSFASTLGWKTGWFDYLLMTITAAASIASFRAVGVLLFLSFLVGPPLIVRRYIKNVKSLILSGCLVSILCSFIGVALSRHMLTMFKAAFSTSGLVATLLFVVYLLVIIHSFVFSYIRQGSCKKNK